MGPAVPHDRSSTRSPSSAPLIPALPHVGAIASAMYERPYRNGNGLALSGLGEEARNALGAPAADLGRLPARAVWSFRIDGELGVVAGQLPTARHENAVVEQRI